MRQRAPSGLKALPGFNPRICKRCDDFKYILKMRNRGFNPRICKRCDLPAPTTCATSCKVSIHASVKDATISFCNLITVSCFNPRICKRCDSGLLSQTHIRFHVSIHASVKDATLLLTVNG